MIYIFSTQIDNQMVSKKKTISKNFWKLISAITLIISHI